MGGSKYDSVVLGDTSIDFVASTRSLDSKYMRKH